MTHDPVKSPDHYTRYPVQPIAITRHLGFCLGNAVKYVMRAPYKGGVQDCDKALQYLEWEAETPQARVSKETLDLILPHLNTLLTHLMVGGDTAVQVRASQAQVLLEVESYLKGDIAGSGAMIFVSIWVRDLREALAKDQPQ